MTVPHVFTAATPIVAADVNANFAAVIPTANQITVTASGTTLVVGQSFAFRSGLSALSATLPAISSVSEGQALTCADGDNNASVNNITLNAAGGDNILYYGTSASSFTIDLNSAAVQFIRSNGAWRAIPLT